MTVTQHRVPLPATAVSLVDVAMFFTLATLMVGGFWLVSVLDARSARLAARR